jgi:hypothetical protein
MGTSIQTQNNFLSVRFQFQHLLWVYLSLSLLTVWQWYSASPGVSMADFRMLQMPCSTHPCDGEEAGGEDQPSEHLNMHKKATYRLHEKSQKISESDFRAVSSPNCEGQMGEGCLVFVQKQYFRCTKELALHLAKSSSVHPPRCKMTWFGRLGIWMLEACLAAKQNRKCGSLCIKTTPIWQRWLKYTDITWNHEKHMGHAVCPTAACLGAGSKAGVWTVKIWDLDRFDT